MAQVNQTPEVKERMHRIFAIAKELCGLIDEGMAIDVVVEMMPLLVVPNTQPVVHRIVITRPTLNITIKGKAQKGVEVNGQ